GDRGVELGPATDGLAGGGADTTADRRERIGLRRDTLRLIIAALCHETDVEPGVGPYRTGRLARCAQVLGPFAQPGAPALPGFPPLSDVPGAPLAPRRFAGLRGGGPRILVERMPAVIGGHMLQRAAGGVGDGVD